MHEYINIAARKEELVQIKESINLLSDKVCSIASPPDRIILTNKELCALLKVCSKTVQKWRDNGILTYSKIGREFFYKYSDVLSMIDTHRQ